MEGFIFIMLVIIYLELSDIHKEVKRNHNAIHSVNGEKVKKYER